MRSMMLIILLTASVAQADNIYPEPGGVIPEVTLPEMPIWWPIWFPTEEPATPVPEIPTQTEMYLADLARVLQIGDELEEIDAELALQKFLLSLDPNGANAPMIQMQIMMLEAERDALEAERQMLRDRMQTYELP